MQQGPSILEQREKESQAKYRQIADILRERILRGRYKPGETIPSYPRLRELFEVSDITVRKAVCVLYSFHSSLCGKRQKICKNLS